MNRIKKRYNRNSGKNLGIEMDLFILFNNKYIVQTNLLENDLPVKGKIKSVSYLPSERGNMLILELDNSTEIKLKVRYGKAIIPENIIITGEQK